MGVPRCTGRVRRGDRRSASSSSSTGHVVLGIVALLGSLPFALAAWVKWADRGI